MIYPKVVAGSTTTIITIGIQGPPGPQGPQGEVGDSGLAGPNEIGGIEVNIPVGSLNTNDLLFYNGSVWTSISPANLTDGGTF